ncbi:MAG TPA: ribonuclease P protein component [Alphaproteobacteria bacterium]
MPTHKTKTPGRLKRRSDFLRVAGTGKKWISPSVIVQVDTESGEGIRFGLTATKKLGNAVIRNRIRRRLRAAANIALAGRPNTDVVLIGRSATVDAPFEQILKDLNWCLKKLGIPTEAIDAEGPA